MRRRLNTLGEQVSRMKAKYHASLREAQSLRIVKADLESNHAETEKMYLRTGRMFRLQSRESITTKMETDAESAAKTAEKLKVSMAQLEIKTRAESQQLRSS